MKTLKEFYDFLVKEEPEAPADAIFGQYAFAPNRKDVPSPPERNTFDEHEVEEAIRAYFAGNDKKHLGRWIPELLKLVDQGYYKAVLSPEKYNKAYRLLELPLDEFAKVVGVSSDKLETMSGDKPGLLGSGVLKPTGASPVAGWTVDPWMFFNFTSMGEGSVIAIFEADVGSNRFLGNPGALAMAVKKPMMVQEMEILSVGPVHYNQCGFVTTNKQKYIAEILKLMGVI